MVRDMNTIALANSEASIRAHLYTICEAYRQYEREKLRVMKARHVEPSEAVAMNEALVAAYWGDMAAVRGLEETLPVFRADLAFWSAYLDAGCAAWSWGRRHG